MIKYDNIDLLIDEVGDKDNREALVLEGESIIDAYNSGNKGVLVRFSPVGTSALMVEGEEIAFNFSKEIQEGFPKALDTKVGKITMYVDRFTGLTYTLVIQGEDSQLFFHNDTKVESETFETRAEGSDEVVFKVTAPLWKKLVKGSWVVDDEMVLLTNESIATSLLNYMGE